MTERAPTPWCAQRTAQKHTLAFEARNVKGRQSSPGWQWEGWEHRTSSHPRVEALQLTKLSFMQHTGADSGQSTGERHSTNHPAHPPITQFRLPSSAQQVLSPQVSPPHLKPVPPLAPPLPPLAPPDPALAPPAPALAPPEPAFPPDVAASPLTPPALPASAPALYWSRSRPIEHPASTIAAAVASVRIPAIEMYPSSMPRESVEGIGSFAAPPSGRTPCLVTKVNLVDLR
jgi:hypothetical protein